MTKTYTPEQADKLTIEDVVLGKSIINVTRFRDSYGSDNVMLMFDDGTQVCLSADGGIGMSVRAVVQAAPEERDVTLTTRKELAGDE